MIWMWTWKLFLFFVWQLIKSVPAFWAITTVESTVGRWLNSRYDCCCCYCCCSAAAVGFVFVLLLPEDVLASCFYYCYYSFCATVILLSHCTAVDDVITSLAFVSLPYFLIIVGAADTCQFFLFMPLFGTIEKNSGRENPNYFTETWKAAVVGKWKNN